MSGVIRFLIASAILIHGAAPLPAQERPSVINETAAEGSLHDLKNKQRLWLVVGRSSLLDASGSSESILNEIYREGAARQNYPRTYNLMARRLNKYIKEHGSMTAARTLSEAEFIIYFNVLEVRRPLGTPYAYGELFIILNEPGQPRILWRSRSGGMFAEDAMKAFLEDLKAVRGEG
jgi:hypothetical protein